MLNEKWYLEEDNNGKNEDGGQEVGNVRQVLSIERFLKSSQFIVTSDQ
jgi:hypothetical protein